MDSGERRLGERVTSNVVELSYGTEALVDEVKVPVLIGFFAERGGVKVSFVTFSVVVVRVKNGFLGHIG